MDMERNECNTWDIPTYGGGTSIQRRGYTTHKHKYVHKTINQSKRHKMKLKIS